MDKIESKYQPGFNPEWLNEELEKRARKQADFYLNNISSQGTDGYIVLVHFFNNGELEQSQELVNQSEFFDCDENWLKSLGVDVDGLKEGYGRSGFVVAIPAQSLSNWVNTLSWKKLSKTGVLDNAFVFEVPADSVIIRNHKFLENDFLRQAANNNEEAQVKNDYLDYYSSTNKLENEQKLTEEMSEAWLSQPISTASGKFLHYQD